MKRLFSLILTICLIASLPIYSSPAEEEVIYFDDGSYIVITVESISTRASGTKSGSKTLKYTGSDGELEWKAVLSGTFTYNGTSATCTSSSCNVTIYASNWYEVSKTVTKSGNTASASVTMGRKVLGITVEKETYPLSLSCDKDGNLS